MFPLTLAAKLSSKQVNLKPVLVFAIDGVPTKFGTTTIEEKIRIGDPGLYIDNYLGDPWYIGGNRPLLDQGTWIALGGTAGATTTRLTQQLQPDKGLGTSVTQLTISMIDKNEQVTKLISPGFVVDEIMGKRCRVELGFEGLSYPDDYIPIFRGFVETIASGAGYVTFYLSSTEQKKRQTLFTRATAKLGTGIPDSGPISTIDLDDATPFLVPVLGPDGTYDSSIKFYVQIGSEYFRYTGKTGNTLTGVTRNVGPFNFGFEEHVVGSDVSSMVRLEGNGLDLARKLMLSGKNGPYASGIEIRNFNWIDPLTAVPNVLFFFGVDLEKEYGIFAGDYVTTTGAANGANNVTLKQILSSTTTNDGTYIEIDGVSFVNEVNTAATVAFRSKWDTLGAGCSMSSNDVDLAEFNRLYTLFLSSFDFDFRIKQGFEGKTFIEQEILRPMTSYSIQRKGRSSVGFHIGPLPNAEIPSLDQTVIQNASKLKLQRSLSKNYYNVVTFELDQDIQTGQFLKLRKKTDQDSLDDFDTGEKGIGIKSTGMRSSLQGETRALSSSNRFLRRYRRGAEWLDGIKVQFGAAFSWEIGDTIILDTETLKVSDTTEGNRSGNSKLVQIMNKEIDISSGEITLSVLDTGFSSNTRYCLISPASKIKSVVSTSVFNLAPSYASVYGGNESLKWQRFGQISVRVRSPDSVTRNAVRQINFFSGNTVNLVTPLPFTPQPDDIMEFTHYNEAGEPQKLVYAFMRDTAFDDGKQQYQMI